MTRILNTQYTQFIIEQVVRPYQGMLGYDKRIERLMFVPTSEPTSFNYADLVNYCSDRPDWFDMVTDRLSKCYEAIDFSFFPNELFAQALTETLLKKGVKEISYYSDALYGSENDIEIDDLDDSWFEDDEEFEGQEYTKDGGIIDPEDPSTIHYPCVQK